jgi:hypothetical protein
MQNKTSHLPSPQQIRQALEIYLAFAYESGLPETVTALLPGQGDFDPAEWIMGEMVEREPPDADLDNVRTAAFRLGNAFYPNMKLRLSRPPNSRQFVFTVDCHDAILQAPPDTADHAMLEELKAHNAKLSEQILAEWDRAGLWTERNYLRHKILQAKQKKDSSPAEDSPAQ